MDTASNYEEAAVGRCLQELADAGAVAREEVVVVTKVGTIQKGAMAVHGVPPEMRSPMKK